MLTGTTPTTPTAISVPVPKSLHNKEHKAPFVFDIMENKNVKLIGGGLKSEDLFEKIICLENLFLAWKEFRKGKSKKIDIQKFEGNLKSSISILHNKLKNKTYEHSSYLSFYVKDPKLRHIHKARVKDRVLHHAVFRILYPIFDKSFIFDSYSCRTGKGTHKAVNRLNDFAGKVSQNNAKTCFVLKLDIKKFFGSVNQEILIDLINKKIKDKNAIWLIEKIIKSFPKGLPLGNITSQLFANIYLNELDKFVKHKLKIRYYIKYCDDFLVLSRDKLFVQNLIPVINSFLENNLELSLHPNKIIIRKYRQGIDFLGYISFPFHRILRTKTKKRAMKNIRNNAQNKHFNQTLQSYFGILKHCNSYKLRRKIIDIIFRR